MFPHSQPRFARPSFKWRVGELYDFSQDPDFYFNRAAGDDEENNFLSRLTRSLTSPLRKAKKEGIDEEREWLEHFEEEEDPVIFGVTRGTSSGAKPVRKSFYKKRLVHDVDDDNNEPDENIDGGVSWNEGMKKIRAEVIMKKKKIDRLQIIQRES